MNVALLYHGNGRERTVSAIRASVSDQIPIGYHLILDVRCAGPAQLADITHVDACLRTLTATLKMQMVGPPVVSPCPIADGQTIAGVSGVVVWLESHASIHTWPEREFLSVDAFSCRAFEPKVALDVLHTHFQWISYNGLWIERFANGPQRARPLSQHQKLLKSSSPS